MTPNNIVNMARLIGLGAISVTDHNSLRQQPAIQSCAQKAGIEYVCGVELQTREEVHVLGYFPSTAVAEVQQWIEERYSGRENRADYFGSQQIMNDQDEVIDEENQLLLDSLNASLEECITMIHQFNGKAVLAHAWEKSNGIIPQLGFIPKNLAFDGIEVRDLKEIAFIKRNSPWIKETLWLCSSDAHQLIDLHEPKYTLTHDQWLGLKGELG